jgi:steroid delta-isomerase
MDEIDFTVKLANYQKYWETITPKTAGLGAKYFAREARYLDPFWDVQGREDIVEIFMNRLHTTEVYKFKVIDAMWGQDGHTAYWRWDLSGVKKGKRVTISGMSEITFDLKGKIISQIDHWDVARPLLSKMPLWGGLLRRLYRKIR